MTPDELRALSAVDLESARLGLIGIVSAHDEHAVNRRRTGIPIAESRVERAQDDRASLALVEREIRRRAQP